MAKVQRAVNLGNINEDIDISKVGENDMPSRWALECGGSPSRGPSLDHRKVALVATWVTNLSVKLGLTPNLTYSQVA